MGPISPPPANTHYLPSDPSSSSSSSYFTYNPSHTRKHQRRKLYAKLYGSSQERLEEEEEARRRESDEQSEDLERLKGGDDSDDFSDHSQSDYSSTVKKRKGFLPSWSYHDLRTALQPAPPSPSSSSSSSAYHDYDHQQSSRTEGSLYNISIPSPRRGSTQPLLPKSVPSSPLFFHAPSAIPAASYKSLDSKRHAPFSLFDDSYVKRKKVAFWKRCWDNWMLRWAAYVWVGFGALWFFGGLGMVLEMLLTVPTKLADPSMDPNLPPPLHTLSFFDNSTNPNSPIYIGVGKADTTAPIGEITMLGYAEPAQSANGIHLRLQARAFIFASPSPSHPPSNKKSPSASHAVYVSIDTAFPSHRLRKLAIKYIAHSLPHRFANYYTEENLMISATHTHGAVGGFSDDWIYQLTNFGIVRGVREKMAKGVARAVVDAHWDLERAMKEEEEGGGGWVGKGKVKGAGVNRSLKSYLNNPEEERVRYETDTDEEMVLVAVREKDGKLKGVANWFGVHGVSMNKSNQYVTGDNKGFASYMWELEEKEKGNERFVAAFGQAASGDVTPNTAGFLCMDTMEPCDHSPSSCEGKPYLCVSRGHGYHDGETDSFSTEHNGLLQLRAAKSILHPSPSSSSTNQLKQLLGPVIHRHAWIDMSNTTFPHPSNPSLTISTCPPAMGHSFIGGTTDGIGLPISSQGLNSTESTHPFLNLLGRVLKKPSRGLVECQHPKPILVDSGGLKTPYAWTPHRVPIQIFVVGRELVILGVPGEVTTMAGRRLKESVRRVLGWGEREGEVVIAGLSNTYSSYITTKEEYQVQRYEGASTLYGPNTLLAYQHHFTQLTKSLFEPTYLPRSGSPEKVDREVSLLPPIILDTPGPSPRKFGQVIQDAPQRVLVEMKFNENEPVLKEGVSVGGSHVDLPQVTARFVCAHPRNGGGEVGEEGVETFMEVQRLDGDGEWRTFLRDGGWDTKFLWERKGLTRSECTLTWTPGRTVRVHDGLYRFKIYGVAKVGMWGAGKLEKYAGVSGAVQVQVI
ncbi:hypothetical protein HDV05_002469 [Chytridiales sp. JEL 0842]|nr:hypothetical protein HDV05_002469 [Chytridiales sp. JEL 0842]